jgi:hypothetical protein
MASEATRGGNERGSPARRDGSPSSAAASSPPDAALGVWLSWMRNQMTAPGAGAAGWLMTPDAAAAAGSPFSVGGDQHQQLAKMLSGDALLPRSTGCGTPTRCAR